MFVYIFNPDQIINKYFWLLIGSFYFLHNPVLIIISQIGNYID